ncbi:hypothetical protein ASF62_10805 [Leifsonia sp. Leaf325]|nr:hypothetical protein [Leifsonia sp. Leaf325]KQQ94553.1 hypothetical protein ASF62_10805 [Leifsonia sp. Leaf325]
MVAQLLGLKVRLFGNLFRRGPWQIVGIIVGLIYGLGIAVFLMALLIGLRFAPDVEFLRDGIVLVGSIVTVGFIVVPLFMGSDDSLDPRRFSLFGMRNRDLSFGLALSAFVGIPALVLAITLVGFVVTWTRGFGEAVVALIAAVLVLATCIMLARVSTSLASLFLATRRAREVSGVLGVLVLVLISPIIVLLAQVDWATSGRGLVREVSAILSWTPLGAMWAIPGDAAAGEWGASVLKLLIALATLWLIWLAWQALVAKTLVTPGRQTQSHAYHGLGWFDKMLPGATGAVAARSLTYWIRDARYWVSLIMIPVLPVLLVVPLAAVQVPTGVLALLPVPVMCIFLGWTVHNDVAYDSTAVWLHVASGVSGFADRIGRLVPAFFLSIPLIALGTIVSMLLYRDWSVLPSFIGVCASLFLVGLGCSSYTSARFPYPVPKPGASPFAQPQSSGTAAATVQSLTFLVALVLTLPALVFGYLALFVDPAWHIATLIEGVGVGLIALVLGVVWGAHTFTKRGPEILASAIRA